MGANVPLNDKLATVTVRGASATELASARDSYEDTWNKWHMVRAVASSAALLVVVMACIVPTTKTQSVKHGEK